MKSLFTLWLLIVTQLVNATWWPESLVGPMPECTNPKITLTSATCDGDPAWKVYDRWWRQLPVQPTPSQISNGF